MIYVGIDPGKNGGVAYVSESGEVSMVKMPTLPLFVSLLHDWHMEFGIKHVFLEKGQAMPGQGVCSTFTNGKHCGELEGALVVMNLPYTLLPPQSWQKEMFRGTLTGEPKKRALCAATRLFPKETFRATTKAIKAHDGMIDAVLMAEYCRRTIR